MKEHSDTRTMTWAQELWQRQPGNVAGLDGLRAMAAILIIAYHCGLFSGIYLGDSAASRLWGPLHDLLLGCWAGIDLFFVLSGFLIGRILLQTKLTHGAWGYRRFLIRRACRIFPAYYLVLLATLFAFSRMSAYQYFVSPDWSLLAERSWSNLLYLNNYAFAGGEANLLSWGWSLCVEEHFYLLLPLALATIWRVAPKRPGRLLCFLILLPMLGRMLQVGLDPNVRQLDGYYYFSHNHFDELLLGVGLAYIQLNHSKRLSQLSQRFALPLEFLGMAIYAVVWTWGGLHVDNGFTLVLQYPLLAVGTLCFMIPCLHGQGMLTRLLAWPIFIPLARVSYGMYLIHPIVIFAMLAWYQERVGDVIAMPAAHFGLLLLCVLFFTWCAAAVLFLGWERRFLALGRRWTTGSFRANN